MGAQKGTGICLPGADFIIPPVQVSMFSADCASPHPKADRSIVTGRDGSLRPLPKATGNARVRSASHIRKGRSHRARSVSPGRRVGP